MPDLISTLALATGGAFLGKFVAPAAKPPGQALNDFPTYNNGPENTVFGIISGAGFSNAYWRPNLKKWSGSKTQVFQCVSGAVTVNTTQSSCG
jgi:hypothetical protein